MRRTSTLETKIVNAHAERAETKTQRAKLFEYLKAKTKAAGEIVEHMQRREAEMPCNSPIPYMNPTLGKK